MFANLSKFFKNICIHKWEYYYPTQCDPYDRMMDNNPANRICSKCDVWQEEDIHCLGLNPPEFIIKWYNYGHC